MVSMVQSCLINTLALWVILTDNERREMNALERIYGYTGGCGMIQGLAAGYFLWDFVLCTRHYKIFGPGLWAHAVSALVVFSFGFVRRERPYVAPLIFADLRPQRPFCNYYGPTFILYELSSPFLNIHWFCDKLNLTGSKIQWYNGIILLATFFSCRLAWGTYQSVHVYQDVWAAMHVNATTPGHLNLSHAPSSAAPLFVPRNGELCLGNESCARAQAEVMRFTGAGTSSIPFWLAGLYLVSNILLNTLNFFWFGRMIETVTKRFKEIPSKGKKVERRPSMVIEVVGGLEQDDRMHGSMVFENEGKSTGMDGGVRVKRR